MSIEQELSDALCELDIYLAMYKDLLHDYMLLESRINNGVRVYAERSFDEEWEAYGRWHKPANATLILILDEQGEE